MKTEANLKEDVCQKAFDLCVGYLSYRDRTELEIRTYLEKKHIDGVVAEQTLGKLKYYGYVDDEKFIRNACEANTRYQHFGRKRLRRELEKKGIPRDMTDRMDRYFTPEDEAACLALQFDQAEKKYAREPFMKKKQKISSYLERRGFSYEAYGSRLAHLQADAGEEAAEREAGAGELERYFEKYARMQSKKGYTGREWRMRVTRNLMGRGFGSDSIRRAFEEYEENQDNEGME